MARAREFEKLNHRFETLQHIVVELINARNPRQLLELILRKGIRLMECDAGSLYLKHSETELIFEIAINESVETRFEKKIIPVSSTGIANYCFTSGQGLNIKDVYQLPKDSPFQFDPSFDVKAGYRTRSVLVQPLRSSKGEILGVLQLINRKTDVQDRWPSQDLKAVDSMPAFSNEDEKLLQSFAAIASASIENAQLYESIENLFQGFVKASVDAIETRDPPTRGHSERVAILCVELAQSVTRSDLKDLRNVEFSDNQIAELRYAALLHDFGKIGVRESTLLKNNKLFDNQVTQIRSRLTEVMHQYEIRHMIQLLNELSDHKRAPSSDDFKNLRKLNSAIKEQMNEYWKIILDLNTPTVLDEDKSTLLKKLKTVKFTLLGGQSQSLLSPEEVLALSITRGSLSDEEREEIQQHVTHTYQFLKKIPWTREYKNIPDIAHAHHEKLNGTGYPRGITEKHIPVQSRIMTIADIFDALVANDRPYKPALPVERALSILEAEAQHGKIDSSLLKVFFEAKVFEHPRFLELTGAPAKKKAA